MFTHAAHCPPCWLLHTLLLLLLLLIWIVPDCLLLIVWCQLLLVWVVGAHYTQNPVVGVHACCYCDTRYSLVLLNFLCAVTHLTAFVCVVLFPMDVVYPVSFVSHTPLPYVTLRLFAARYRSRCWMRLPVATVATFPAPRCTFTCLPSLPCAPAPLGGGTGCIVRQFNATVPCLITRLVGSVSLLQYRTVAQHSSVTTVYPLTEHLVAGHTHHSALFRVGFTTPGGCALTRLLAYLDITGFG